MSDEVQVSDPNPGLARIGLAFLPRHVEHFREAERELRYSVVQCRMKGSTPEEIAEAGPLPLSYVRELLGMEVAP